MVIFDEAAPLEQRQQFLARGGTPAAERQSIDLADPRSAIFFGRTWSGPPTPAGPPALVCYALRSADKGAHWEEIPFTLPDTAEGDVWQVLIDTAEPDRPLSVRVRPQGEQFPLYGRSVALLRTVRAEEAEQAISSTQASVLRREASGSGRTPAPADKPLVP